MSDDVVIFPTKPDRTYRRKTGRMNKNNRVAYEIWDVYVHQETTEDAKDITTVLHFFEMQRTPIPGSGGTHKHDITVKMHKDDGAVYFSDDAIDGGFIYLYPEQVEMLHRFFRSKKVRTLKPKKSKG